MIFKLPVILFVILCEQVLQFLDLLLQLLGVQTRQIPFPFFFLDPSCSKERVIVNIAGKATLSSLLNLLIDLVSKACLQIHALKIVNHISFETLYDLIEDAVAVHGFQHARYE